jgi:hypothetical protein
LISKGADPNATVTIIEGGTATTLLPDNEQARLAEHQLALEEDVSDG